MSFFDWTMKGQMYYTDNNKIIVHDGSISNIPVLKKKKKTELSK